MAIPVGYELTPEGQKYANFFKDRNISEAEIAGFTDPSTGKPMITKSIVNEGANLLAGQKEELKKNLGDLQTRENQMVDDTAAARGISRGGSVLAGYSDVATKYANLLNSGNLNLTAQNQQYEMAKQDQLLRQKYYDLAAKQAGVGRTPTVSSGGFQGIIPPAYYDSTANRSFAEELAKKSKQLWA